MTSEVNIAQIGGIHEFSDLRSCGAFGSAMALPGGNLLCMARSAWLAGVWALCVA
jgi:hypothetical protein